MSMQDRYGDHPCHRVVNHAGRTAPGWSEQRQLLEKEGVKFNRDEFRKYAEKKAAEMKSAQ
jgi:methylated-DNA-protein-cysteine methyltransferase-like protein